MLIVGLVALNIGRANPIQTVGPAVYWSHACGIELHEYDGSVYNTQWTGIYPEKEGWYFYYYQQHHGRRDFKIKKENLTNSVDEVFSLLDKEITTTRKVKPYPNHIKTSNQKRTKCLAQKQKVSSDKAKFVDLFSGVVKTDARSKMEAEVFNNQWERSKLYWLTILFEMVFLPFWWLFTFHRGIFGKFNQKQSNRLAYSPLILFLPHFLGYAPYMFSFGASGGIVYPLFAMIVSIPFVWFRIESIDSVIYELLPQPLWHISQIPSSPMAISFSSAISPSVVILYTLTVLLVAKVIKQVKSQ